MVGRALPVAAIGGTYGFLSPMGKDENQWAFTGRLANAGRDALTFAVLGEGVNGINRNFGTTLANAGWSGRLANGALAGLVNSETESVFHGRGWATSGELVRGAASMALMNVGIGKLAEIGGNRGGFALGKWRANGNEFDMTLDLGGRTADVTVKPEEKTFNQLKERIGKVMPTKPQDLGQAEEPESAVMARMPRTAEELARVKAQPELSTVRLRASTIEAATVNNPWATARGN